MSPTNISADIMAKIAKDLNQAMIDNVSRASSLNLTFANDSPSNGGNAPAPAVTQTSTLDMVKKYAPLAMAGLLLLKVVL